MCLYVKVFVLMCLQEGQRRTLDILLNNILPYSLETESITEHGAKPSKLKQASYLPLLQHQGYQA